MCEKWGGTIKTRDLLWGWCRGTEIDYGSSRLNAFLIWKQKQKPHVKFLWSSNLPHHFWLSEAGPWIRQDLTQPSSSWVSLPKNCTKTQPRGFGLCASRVWFDLRSTTDSAGMKYFWVVLFCFFPIQPWSQPFPQFSVCSLWGPGGGMFCKGLFFFHPHILV